MSETRGTLWYASLSWFTSELSWSLKYRSRQSTSSCPPLASGMFRFGRRLAFQSSSWTGGSKFTSRPPSAMIPNVHSNFARSFSTRSLAMAGSMRTTLMPRLFSSTEARTSGRSTACLRCPGSRPASSSGVGGATADEGSGPAWPSAARSAPSMWLRRAATSLSRMPRSRYGESHAAAASEAATSSATGDRSDVRRAVIRHLRARTGRRAAAAGPARGTGLPPRRARGIARSARADRPRARGSGPPLGRC